MALSYGKKKDDGNLKRFDVRMAKIESSGSYVVRSEITITMYGIARAAEVCVRRSSADSFVSRLVGLFQVSTIKIILSVGCELSAECSTNITHTKLRLTFVKSRYLIVGYFPTIWDIDFEKGVIREPV